MEKEKKVVRYRLMIGEVYSDPSIPGPAFAAVEIDASFIQDPHTIHRALDLLVHRVTGELPA